MIRFWWGVVLIPCIMSLPTRLTQMVLMEALPAKQTRFSQCEPTVIDDRLDRWIRYTEKQREVLYSIHLTVINNKGGTRLVSSVMLTDHRKACFLWSFCVFNVQPLTCMVKMGLYLFNLCRCGNFFCLFVCFVVFLEFPFFVDFFFFFWKKKGFYGLRALIC